MIVNLHGKLGRKYGKRHSFKVRNSKDAIEALGANFPGFKQNIVNLTQKGIFYKAVKDKENVCKGVPDYYEKCEEIDIVPSVIGSGAAGMILAGAGATFFGVSLGMSGLVYLGIGLIIYGIIALLFPFEMDNTQQEGRIETESYIFNNMDNNAVQGFRVPIVYGQVRVGASVISTNIDAFDIGRAIVGK